MNRSLTDFLRTAMEPVGSTMYIWGGGWNSEDNGARYVPVWEYIRKFGKSPDPEKCYRAICWPDSQEYIGNEECELIQDEEALEKFGSSAYWVPARYKNGKV